MRPFESSTGVGRKWNPHSPTENRGWDTLWLCVRPDEGWGVEPVSSPWMASTCKNQFNSIQINSIRKKGLQRLEEVRIGTEEVLKARHKRQPEGD